VTAKSVKHISVWRLAASAEPALQDAARQLKCQVERLRGCVPGLRTIELGLDIGGPSQRSDVVLYSEFESLEYLHNYQDHPEHLALVTLLDLYRIETRVVDYHPDSH